MSDFLEKTKAGKLENMPPMLELLEARIAPASLDGVSWKAVSFETPILVKAGQGLSTTGDGTGTYLLHVSSGEALVFATDLNGNGAFDQNEITGISAGDGLNLTSFVDINGDIVTNLNADGTLTDLDPLSAGNDGCVLLNSKISGLTIRSLTSADSDSYLNHLAYTTYSLYGNIYAGGGFGSSSGGLVIDTAGWTSVQSKYNGTSGSEYYAGSTLYPNVGNIMTGTAASGEWFSFGLNPNSPSSLHGQLATFTPAAGASGGDIIGIHVGNGASTDLATYQAVQYQIGGLQTGNGGSGARAGNISNVTLYGDIGGFFAITGDGGTGTTGGAGGSITNLADLGSDNARVEIQTGHGGQGLNGKGGAGGSLSLGQFSTSGNVSILLGDGGDGTAGGGAGAGLNTGTFTPMDITDVPLPLKLVSTYRADGDIGMTQQIDFNDDGIGDIVYISENPSQLVVRLGQEVQVYDELTDTYITNYGITSSSPTYYLAAPMYSDAVSASLVVGDMDNDGVADFIATASSANYSSDGLYVYLWDSATESFSNPLRSAIPYWNLGGTSGIDYLASGGAVTDMVVGDFDGDDNLDIAFTAQYRESTLSNGLVTGLVVMSGLGDGYFYADTEYDSENVVWTKVPVVTVVSGSSGHSEILLQATSLMEGDTGTPETLLTGVVGKKSISTYSIDGGLLENDTSFSGKYRTRSYNDTTDEVEFSDGTTDITLADFTLLDVNNDGNADLIALSDGDGVIVAFEGDGAGAFDEPPNNNGIYLTGEFGVLGSDATELNSTFAGIVTGDFDANAGTVNFAVYSLGNAEDTALGFYLFTIDGFEQNYDSGEKAPNGDVDADGSVTFSKPDPVDTDVVVFSTYQGFDGLAVGFAIGTPNSEKSGSAKLQIRATTDSEIYSNAVDLADYGFLFEGGDGGNSQLGAGGAGGSIGSGTLTVAEDGTVTGGVTLWIPMGETNGGFSQNFSYLAGNGGDGFTAGGTGGKISGFVAQYVPGSGSVLASNVDLTAGNGGESIQGTGGKGGDVSKISVQTLWYAKAGDGGDGMTGGAGGNISGNGNSAIVDATTNWIYLYSGQGGEGIAAGGNGGNISSFKTGFLSLIGGVGGRLTFEAGDGGDSVSGRGGNGGSITNSAPLADSNYLAGNIFVTAGDGGSGQSGGNGGSITTFVNDPKSGSSPDAVSFMAGNGGAGVSSTGGNGGSITGVTVGGSGQDEYGELLFNRFLAGQGGNSYSGVGGNGGDISSVIGSSTNTSLAIAAGAGGFGLTKGGLGGSVLSSKGTSAGGDSKVLVIAGDGGDAYAFLATTLSSTPSLQDNLKAIGGVNGSGGNGGSIGSFKSTGQDVRTDLVAGNGGNLINYGAGLTKVAVGKGGSVTNITLEGDAGDIDQDVAIVGYTSLGTPMADFVTGWLALNQGVLLTNAQGNVGVLVGAAGRVSVSASPSTQGSAALDGVNGSVSTFSAKNIMSMIAGSVDRISAILSINGLSVPSGGALGAYKTNPYAHSNTPAYYEPNGVTITSTASVGGQLMDGAIVAISKQASLSGPRVF